jgi:ParB family chromosome partitioning protein
LSRKDIHEARTLRDAEEVSPGIIDRVIDDRVEMGVEPTKAAIKNAAEAATGKHVRGTFGTGENEGYTPQEYVEAARLVLGHFDLDPASSAHANEHHVKALNFYTQEDNGLARDWFGRVWMNPPYSQPLITQFCEKLRAEYEAGEVAAAVALTHNYSDTGWFHHLAAVSSALCFTKGRVRFESPDGTKASPTQGQTFFYLGDQPRVFVENFARFGLCLVRAE